MSNENAVQVSTPKTEEEMANMLAGFVGFLTDATKLPSLRKELEALRAECESLKREKEDLHTELTLEREDKQRHIRHSNEHAVLAQERQVRLQSLQHKFDTIQGIVAAAMDEVKADERSAQVQAERKVEETVPWNPSSPLRSVS